MPSSSLGVAAGIYDAHPYSEPDCEGVSRPVDVRVAIMRLVVSDYDEKFMTATVSYQVVYSWVDPRLAGWPEGAALPPDLWVPGLLSAGITSNRDP